jgi:hypothetical protein
MVAKTTEKKVLVVLFMIFIINVDNKTNVAKTKKQKNVNFKVTFTCLWY